MSRRRYDATCSLPVVATNAVGQFSEINEVYFCNNTLPLIIALHVYFCNRDQEGTPTVLIIALHPMSFNPLT